MNAPTQTVHSGRWTVLLALTACVLAPLFLAQPQSASAALSFCPPGSGAGQCVTGNAEYQRGLATDFETDRVYVADRGNNRVNVFKADGQFLFAFGWGVDTGAGELETCTPASTCQAGVPGSGPGQFDRPTRVAVDNDPLSPSRHAVYVGTDSFRVQKFTPAGEFQLAFGKKGSGECEFENNFGIHGPIGVGPGGVVHVLDGVPLGGEEYVNRVHKFDGEGNCVGAVSLPVIHRVTNTMAVDSNGDIYVHRTVLGGQGFTKYDPSGTELYSRDLEIRTNALAVDAADNLYSQQIEFPEGGSFFRVLTAYDAAGNPLSRFGYEQMSENSAGLAADVGGAGVFVSESDGVDLIEFPPPGPITPPSTVKVTAIGNTKATIAADVNPEGKETEIVFEYVDDASFDVEGFEGPATKSSDPVVVAAGFRLKLAEPLIGCPVATEELIEEGKCLEPETEYHFRVVATNADNPTGSGEATAIGPTFTTKDAVEIEAVWSSEVGTDGARINADVNPLGIPASGHFEYVDEANYQLSGFAEANRIPDTEAGAAPIDFGAAEAATTRSATLFPLAPGTTYRYRLVATNPFLDQPLLSEERILTTFSPPAPGPCPNDALRTGAAALLPDCRAYEMVSPLDKANGDIVVLPEATTIRPAVLNRSATSGAKLAYGSYRAFGDAESAPYTSQYIASRGAAGWASEGISPPQEEAVVTGLLTWDTGFRHFSEDLCEAWLTTVAEPPLAAGAPAGYENLYRQEEGCEGEGGYEALSAAAPANLEGTSYQIGIQGVSADGGRAIFQAKDNLTAGTPAQPAGCLTDPTAGCRARVYEHVRGQGLRYVCVLPGEVAHAGHCSAGFNSETVRDGNRKASLQNAISADGSRIFWTAGKGAGKIYARIDGQQTVAVSATAEALSGTSALGSRYWNAAQDGSKALFTTGGDLYEFELAGPVTRKIAGGVSGLLGASQDASRVYLVSSEARAAGAEAGELNLYLYEAGAGGGTFRFIAQLAARDLDAWAIEPWQHSSRVSPDGTHVAFMSVASPTGYDNLDAASGEADAEVYLYDAAADGGEGALACASCNPSGARPAGREIGGDWIAARLPVWQNSLNAARVLSDDGSRLYFESFDALVARDTNGHADVYQWEKPGRGSCTTGAPTYSPSARGCIELISSGQSVRDSQFIEASPSGEDVFFATLTSLLPQDYGLTDVYDARAGGGLPYTPPREEDCEGESCQTPAAPPRFQTPATATYEGPGNLAAQAGKQRRCPQGKRKARRKGKVRCVKRKRAKRTAKRAQHRKRTPR